MCEPLNVFCLVTFWECCVKGTVVCFFCVKGLKSHMFHNSMGKGVHLLMCHA